MNGTDSLMGSSDAGFDADLAAMRALAGHRDDVRTVFAWMLALNGRLNSISNLIDEANLEAVEVARSWDGLDNSALCDALEAAFDALDPHEKALS